MIVFTVYQVIKFAFQGFWRNFWLSLVTISVIVLAFISINFLIVINKVSESSLKLIEERIDVSIYLQHGTDDETIQLIENELKSISQISSVTFISGDQALEDFRQKHKNELTILQSLEELDENPLGGTFVIKAKDIGDYAEVLRLVDNSKYSSAILDRNYEDNRTIIEKINEISGNINRFGVAITSIFIIISMLIVFNTIKLAIYTHQKEIAVMKLVGASDSFIAFPYIFESMLYALFACIITILIFFPLLSFVQPYVNGFFQGYENEIINLRRYFKTNIIAIFGVQLIAVVILNIIASYIAVRRYLKV